MHFQPGVDELAGPSQQAIVAEQAPAGFAGEFAGACAHRFVCRQSGQHRSAPTGGGRAALFAWRSAHCGCWSMDQWSAQGLRNGGLPVPEC